MKLIVGLGNPGPEYAKTRHNAGFLALDVLIRRHSPAEIPRSKFRSMVIETRLGPEKCALMKPLTYMNLSGAAVAEAVRFYKADPARDLLVLVDEAALDVGTIRLRGSGGAGGHNGLRDIQQKLGSENYPRLRIGIGPRPGPITLHDFVLGRFPEESWPTLEAALARAADAAELFAAQGLDAAMNRFNTTPEPPPPSAEGRPPDPASPRREPSDRL
jgi:PTH1 family peptidyl-tRNA hydrolase